MEERHEVVTIKSSDGNIQKQTSITKDISFSDFIVLKTKEIIFTIVGVISLLLFIRIILFLLGASQIGIVSFIISITQIFIAPFVGIFSSVGTIGNSYFDIASMVAIVFYLIFGTIFAAFVGLFSSRSA